MRGLLPRRAGLLAAAALAVAVAVSGCTASGLKDQDGIGDSGVVEVPLAKRAAPVTFSGTLDDGSTWSSKTALGHVVVVNFWYADCPPCRIEATDLAKIDAEFASQGVVFRGVNTRDSRARVESFDQKFDVGYPSILDADSGSVQLAFSGSYRPNSTPTTIVLDKKGRVAARMEGPITGNDSTLETLIRSALAEAG